MRPRYAVLAAAGLLCLAGLGAAAAQVTDADLALLKAQYVAPRDVPQPADNPSTPQKVALGRKLFFDPDLSADGRFACATCHDVRFGFTDGQQLSAGVPGEILTRHTPTLVNVAWSKAYFWDGRAPTLEAQAEMPIANVQEMAMPHDLVLKRLEAPDYRALFAGAYPGEPAGPATAAKALAAFERTLVFADAPFDRWIAGDETAIPEAAKRGFIAFNTDGGCFQCHSGWNFTDFEFRDLGVATTDLGRFGAGGDEKMRNAFKTPGLRNIAQSGPYMHDGHLRTLSDVLGFYNNGFIRRPTLAPELAKVSVRSRDDIIAFLRTLSTPVPEDLVREQEALERKTQGRPGKPIIVPGYGPVSLAGR